MRTTNKERIKARVIAAATTMTMMTTTTKNKELGAIIRTNKERLTQMYNPSSYFMKNVMTIRNVYLQQQITEDYIPDLDDLQLQGRWIVNPFTWMYPSATPTASPTTSPSLSTTNHLVYPTAFPSASPIN